MKTANRYAQIIERIFSSHYKKGIQQFDFDREELVDVAGNLKIKLPKNLGDVIYSFRYRVPLPESVQATAPIGKSWIIRPAGQGKYRFALVEEWQVVPTAGMSETKVPDSTPGVITKYCLSDEQALLARLRYNRLIDIFTSVTCYSLQNHLRTQVKDVGQIETDEIYVGIDQKGVHYVFPVQAKGGKDQLSIIQIEQDIALCKTKFPSLVCRPIAAQFMDDSLIALFSFEETDRGVARAMEKHYRLVPPDQVTSEDLKRYQERLPNG
ncbi:MAG: endonuclease [Blastocatellia bacterium]